MNYIDDLSIYGLMNKNAECSQKDGIFGYYRTKDKLKIAAFNRLDENTECSYKQINYMYADEKLNIKGETSMQEIHSILDQSMFYDDNDKEKNVLPGKKFIELRGTRNKFERLIKDGSFQMKSLDESNASNVLEMIEKWRWLDNGGKKYGFIEHAGIDKALVKRIIADFQGIKDKILAKVFFFNGECVGYSTIQKTGKTDSVSGIVEYKYLTRKTLNMKDLRNLTEYVDYKTFESLWNEKKDEKFIINWGCSSKKLAWYKMHKFPLYNTETKWFATVKNG